jgi:prephenate dehydrogenase
MESARPQAEEPAFFPPLSQAQIAIIGLGLMGGSLAAALTAHHACGSVVGVARRSSTLQMARSLRFIDRGARDVQSGVREADLVVLATPVRDILDKLAQIGPWLKPGCVVLDIGSTKSAICQAMAQMPPHVQPLGGHPMTGKESSGITMAEPNLYRDRVFVLTPLARTAPGALALARELAEAVGARPLLLDAERHDRLVAAISHLPYMLAVTLVQAAAALADDDTLAWQLAAGGFRDTSRVAAGNIEMMMDILVTNRQPILQALRQAQAQLATLEADLLREDYDHLKSQLDAARERRREVFP